MSGRCLVSDFAALLNRTTPVKKQLLHIYRRFARWPPHPNARSVPRLPPELFTCESGSSSTLAFGSLNLRSVSTMLPGLNTGRQQDVAQSVQAQFLEEVIGEIEADHLEAAQLALAAIAIEGMDRVNQLFDLLFWLYHGVRKSGRNGLWELLGKSDRFVKNICYHLIRTSAADPPTVAGGRSATLRYRAGRMEGPATPPALPALPSYKAKAPVDTDRTDCSGRSPFSDPPNAGRVGGWEGRDGAGDSPGARPPVRLNRLCGGESTPPPDCLGIGSRLRFPVLASGGDVELACSTPVQWLVGLRAPAWPWHRASHAVRGTGTRCKPLYFQRLDSAIGPWRFHRLHRLV